LAGSAEDGVFGCDEFGCDAFGEMICDMPEREATVTVTVAVCTG